MLCKTYSYTGSSLLTDPHCDLEARDLNSTGEGVAEWVKEVEGEGAWMGLWMVKCESEWRGRVLGGM